MGEPAMNTEIKTFDKGIEQGAAKLTPEKIEQVISSSFSLYNYTNNR